MKMFSLTALEGMQIKLQKRISLLPIRIAAIEKTNSKCWQAHGEPENTHVLLVRLQISAPTVNISMEAPQKPKGPNVAQQYHSRNKSACHRAVCTYGWLLQLGSQELILPVHKSWEGKRGIHTQWNFIQTQRKKKLCHLQEKPATGDFHRKGIKVKTRKTDVVCFLSTVDSHFYMDI